MCGQLCSPAGVVGLNTALSGASPMRRSIERRLTASSASIRAMSCPWVGSTGLNGDGTPAAPVLVEGPGGPSTMRNSGIPRPKKALSRRTYIRLGSFRPRSHLEIMSAFKPTARWFSDQASWATASASSC